MSAKIRLQRHGKKGQPFYHIVVADGRAPRDGKFIEKIGTYNPIPDPAEINLNFDKALEWVNKGAQPTDTVRSILSKKGVMLKKHLLIGVQKGAMTMEQAEVKFQKWLDEKNAKVAQEVKNNVEKNRAEKKVRLEAETKVCADRAAAIAKRKEEEAAKDAAATEEAQAAEEAPATEEAAQ